MWCHCVIFDQWTVPKYSIVLLELFTSPEFAEMIKLDFYKSFIYEALFIMK